MARPSLGYQFVVIDIKPNEVVAVYVQRHYDTAEEKPLLAALGEALAAGALEVRDAADVQLNEFGEVVHWQEARPQRRDPCATDF